MHRVLYPTQEVMYTKYEVNGVDSFGENFQKPRKCTDGRTDTKRGPSRKQSVRPMFNRAGHKNGLHGWESICWWCGHPLSALRNTSENYWPQVISPTWQAANFRPHSHVQGDFCTQWPPTEKTLVQKGQSFKSSSKFTGFEFWEKCDIFLVRVPYFITVSNLERIW